MTNDGEWICEGGEGPKAEEGGVKLGSGGNSQQSGLFCIFVYENNKIISLSTWLDADYPARAEGKMGRKQTLGDASL